MLTDDELRAHKLAALFDQNPLFQRNQAKPDIATQFQPQPKPDLTAPAVVAAVADLNKEFADTLAPDALPSLPPSSCIVPASFINAHSAIIDQLLINPQITTKELARQTGYSRGWLTRILSSDAFQAKLAERTKLFIDPLVMAKIEDRLKGMTSMALEILEEKLEQTGSADLALNVLALTTKSLGYGAKQPLVAVQQSFIVHVPPKVVSSAAWAAQHSGRGIGLGTVTETDGGGSGSGAELDLGGQEPRGD